MKNIGTLPWDDDVVVRDNVDLQLSVCLSV